jgi:hypothetical protein
MKINTFIPNGRCRLGPTRPRRPPLAPWKRSNPRRGPPVSPGIGHPWLTHGSQTRSLEPTAGSPVALAATTKPTQNTLLRITGFAGLLSGEMAAAPQPRRATQLNRLRKYRLRLGPPRSCSAMAGGLLARVLFAAAAWVSPCRGPHWGNGPALWPESGRIYAEGVARAGLRATHR